MYFGAAHFFPLLFLLLLLLFLFIFVFNGDYANRYTRMRRRQTCLYRPRHFRVVVIERRALWRRTVCNASFNGAPHLLFFALAVVAASASAIATASCNATAAVAGTIHRHCQPPALSRGAPVALESVEVRGACALWWRWWRAAEAPPRTPGRGRG